MNWANRFTDKSPHFLNKYNISLLQFVSTVFWGGLYNGPL